MENRTFGCERSCSSDHRPLEAVLHLFLMLLLLGTVYLYFNHSRSEVHQDSEKVRVPEVHLFCVEFLPLSKLSSHNALLCPLFQLFEI